VKLGAEPKKVALLLGLLAVAAAIFYYQFASGPDVPSSAQARGVSPPEAQQIKSAAGEIIDGPAARPRPSQRATNDFKPTLKRTKQGERLDPAKVDPTLRMDLLARVQSVAYDGVERNLFLFGAPKPKITTPPPEAVKPATAPAAAAPNPPETPSTPMKPPPPPINMRYFGFASRPGDLRKRAFLMEGEEIYVAAEGEVIKKRYKVVRIGINSIVVEDLDHKSQQTLPLQEG